jgi:septation ring formation regulator EzrA
MPDKDDLIDPNELKELMYQGAENFDDLSAQRMDEYDDLIKKIILIEKMHKYGSSGLEKKIKEIEELIEAFINKEG